MRSACQNFTFCSPISRTYSHLYFIIKNMNIKQMLLKNIGKNNRRRYKYFALALVIIMSVASVASVILANVSATVTDTFSDSSKIASSASVTVSGGAVTLSVSSAWSCGDLLIDSRDAQTYATVLIGAQCWMRQNINVGTMTAGVNTQGADCPSSAAIEKYCYSNSEANCTSNGALYQWDQAMCGSITAGATGICPTGWHIPTHDEFTTLERAVCASGSCATDFPYDATTSGWRGTNEGTTLKTVNSSSFSGLLAGLRATDGSFVNLGSDGYFWSSLQSGSSAWSRHLGSGNAAVYRYTFTKTYGFSVRCVKN